MIDNQLLDNSMEVDEINQKLLEILSTEISRDGGASLVRDLKDYAPAIGPLLKRSSKPKLLAFLEQFPEIFSVERETLPHVVYLLKDDFACFNDAPLSQQSIAKDEIKDRIICVLKKQRSRVERRNKSNATASRVSAIWLLNQCKGQLHNYLRLRGEYQRTYSDCKDVRLVGSDEWNSLVSKEFISIAKECCEYDDGRFFLRQKGSVDVEALASMLTEKVEKDGGTHISYGLLLHRFPELSKLLVGEDLMRLKVDHPLCFDRVDMFMRDNEVYLQSNAAKEGRMEVDETGHFSVTSSRMGNLFATMMAKKCRSMLSEEPENTIAIDLTASVGGITLPLAKAFERVIAFEIDCHRADLCRRNMLKHGVSQSVDVRNHDSIDMLPDLALELDRHPRVVAIDPREFIVVIF